MTILLDEGQQAIATESRRIAEARADQARALALLEGDGSYDEGWWTMAGEQGWSALAVPEEHGGLGLGQPGIRLRVRQQPGADLYRVTAITQVNIHRVKDRGRRK